MGIIVDIILVAIVALNVVLGYKKGLVNVIFNICAFLIAIIATLILYKPVSSMIINNTNVTSKIESIIIKNNSKTSEQVEEENEVGLKNYVDNLAKDAKENTMETIAKTVSYKAVEVITGILLFIVIRIVVILLKFLFESLAELPLIKQCNQIGGIAYGLIKALIIIYILLTVAFIAVSLRGNGIISDVIDSSYITKFLYENNIIVKYCLLGKNLI